MGLCYLVFTTTKLNKHYYYYYYYYYYYTWPLFHSIDICSFIPRTALYDTF